MARFARRRFLLGGGLAAAGATPLSWVFNRTARAASDFGPLEPDPHGILDLPAGFEYSVLERAGNPMDDGYRIPGLPDGMACFPLGSGQLALMRNHELGIGATIDTPYGSGAAPPEAYDPQAMGCVTRLVVDATTFRRVSSNLVLAGTDRNCAGGMSPWGWLSCEETVADGHGYVFLCDPDASIVEGPVRIVGYGRFRHEAAVVDPSTNICYLTEDRGDGAFYRFLPDAMDVPFVGKLQALKLVGMPDYDTGTGMPMNTDFEVEWVDLDDPDPEGDTLRSEAQSKGATIFRRGEGIWFDSGCVYMAATSGGAAGAGQIFRHIPGTDDHSGSLELLTESPEAALLNMPDNIAMSPWGDLFMAEDSPGTANYIRLLTPSGEVCDFARNVFSGSEFAGVCFSPGGDAMFVNLWGDGLTFAVTGPFPKVDGATSGSSDEGSSSGGDGDGDGGEETGDDGLRPDVPPDDTTAGPVVGEAIAEPDCACDASSEPGRAAATMAAAIALFRRRTLK